MSAVYWGIKDSLAEEKNVPHVYVGERSNGRKWKWFVDVDSIYIDDRDKVKISEDGVSDIFDKARELDEEAQTPDSARHYSDREEIWELEKNRSQGIFRLVLRDKESAKDLADFIAKVIEKEFKMKVSA